MYQTTSEVKNLFKKYYRQVVEIRFYGTEETIELNEENLIQNSFTLDRYTVTGNDIEVGTAVAAEITFTLDNRDGRFDNVTLEGGEMFVQVGIKKWDAGRWEKATVQYIPLGYYIVEGSPRRLRSIEVTAYDRMRKFDQIADSALFYDGATVASYIRSCCEACGVTLATNLDSLPNSTYQVPTFPEGDEITYRQIIQWCAAITGTCAYFDWNGHLRFEWYTDNVTGETIEASDRYDSDIYENDVVITGVSCTLTNDEGDDVDYSVGEEGYVLDLSDCLLLQSEGEVQEAIDALGAKLVGFSYRPYSCETKPMPWLYPLDTIEYIDKNGNSHTTIITNATFSINAHSDFEAKGETAIASSYYYSSMTDRISQIIATTKKNSKRITTAEQMLSEFNEQLQNASGLYSTVEGSGDAAVYYFHDKSTLEESNVIYVFNSGGFAWTTSGWDGDDTVWQYGFDSAGNGILNNVLMNYLNVNKLTADEINVANIVGAINESTGESKLVITAEHLELSGSDIIVNLQNSISSVSDSVTGLSDDLDDLSGTVDDLSGTVTELGNTVSEIQSSLTLYVSSSELALTLERYALTTTVTAVSEDLSSLSGTVDGLSDDLGDLSENVSAIGNTVTEIQSSLTLYMTSEELSVTLARYALQEDGSDTSFKYTLTADGFTMTANGETVLEANASGLSVYGAIYAEEGEIAGLLIEANYSYSTGGAYEGAVRRFGNPTDTFHILVTEDTEGNATDTEVLITDLYCDNIIARNSSNSIDLCYVGDSTEITATLTWSATNFVNITIGSTVISRRITISFRIDLSGTLLTDKRLTLRLVSSDGNTITQTITISKGRTYYSESEYYVFVNPGETVASIYFSDSGESTTTFTTTEETDQMVKIKGNVIPDESGTYNFGHSEKLWGDGYFTNLYLGDYPVAAPYRSLNSTVTVYESSGNSVSNFSSTDTSASIRVITLGNLRISVVEYTGGLSTDRWYRFYSTNLGTILGLTVVPRANSSATLNNYNYGGSLCCYYDGSYVYIGCDVNSCNGGFIATIIGLAS